jgi:preprotein translocase subunit SecE
MRALDLRTPLIIVVVVVVVVVFVVVVIDILGTNCNERY